jgi:class 3 adenylate cyclase/tetratricopeptide (TPR) repeat protein
MLVCPECGRENPADARFCSGCGASFEVPSSRSREERKVVSVLFADLVGFTSKAEQLDPEDVRATLSPYYARLRGELERHGGTVEKFIGDAVMAVFGAPVAHEDDPERAVRAGLAIRDAIVEDDRLQVRVAVTTGEALVSLGASPTEGEGMVAGDVVNTAARLQSAAPVNGILVDETTYRSTRARIDYHAAAPVTAKGKTEPVAVWEAVEGRSRFGVDLLQAETPFVGRRSELDFLADALARTRESRSPQLVTLVGVPGIGKSRLVHELSRIADADPELITWRQGRSLPYGDGVAYWALGEMIKAHAGILETDSPEEAELKLARVANDLQGDGRLLEGLRLLVGLGSDGDARGDDRSRRFAAWRQFFESVAEQSPTVLVFEDLHWADDDLLDFVDHLVDWSTGVPLLVVCTARPELLERRPGWGGGKPNALTLSISPLSSDDTAGLIAGLLERAVLPAELQQQLLERAGGNPLYAEQFARLVLEAPKDAELTLPENVQGIIAARVDGLPPEDKQLLQDAAVVGKVFWLGAAAAVGGRSRDDAEQRLHALERKEFLRRERRSAVGGEEQYAFGHVLVRDVAYGQIPRPARAAKHERAAGWLESLAGSDDNAELLAHHYLEALGLRRAAGLETTAEFERNVRVAARAAGDRALALGAFAVAARFYEAALELWPVDDVERAAVLLAYGRSRVDDTTIDDNVLNEAYERFLERGDVESAAEAEAMLGGVWMARGDQAETLRHLDRAASLVEGRGPSAAKAYVLQELARGLMMAEDFERSIPLARESLEIAEQLGLDPVRSRNLNTLGVGRVHRGDRRGLADLEQAVAIAAAASSHEEASAIANLMWMTVIVGDLRRAEVLHEESSQTAERLGLRSYIDWQRAERVVMSYWRGDWQTALADADVFIRESETGPSHYMDSICRGVRALILLARGRYDAALEESVRGNARARETRDPQVLNAALAIELRVRVAADQQAEGNGLADELLRQWRHGVQAPTEAIDAAWGFLSLGRSDEFLAAYPPPVAETPWHAAGRAIAAEDFATAAAVCAEIGTVADETYARLRAAEAAVARADRAEADRELALALPVCAQLGASAWTALGESLLAESA